MLRASASANHYKTEGNCAASVESSEPLVQSLCHEAYISLLSLQTKPVLNISKYVFAVVLLQMLDTFCDVFMMCFFTESQAGHEDLTPGTFVFPTVGTSSESKTNNMKRTEKKTEGTALMWTTCTICAAGPTLDILFDHWLICRGSVFPALSSCCLMLLSTTQSWEDAAAAGATRHKESWTAGISAAHTHDIHYTSAGRTHCLCSLYAHIIILPQNGEVQQ